MTEMVAYPFHSKTRSFDINSDSDINKVDIEDSAMLHRGVIEKATQRWMPQFAWTRDNRGVWIMEPLDPSRVVR